MFSVALSLLSSSKGLGYHPFTPVHFTQAHMVDSAHSPHWGRWGEGRAWHLLIVLHSECIQQVYTPRASQRPERKESCLCSHYCRSGMVNKAPSHIPHNAQRGVRDVGTLQNWALAGPEAMSFLWLRIFSFSLHCPLLLYLTISYFSFKTEVRVYLFFLTLHTL